MYHALEINEILFNIIAHLHPGDDISKRSDLLALATTCRTFKEPALDILWDDMDDLFPLVRCIPGAFHPLPHDNKQYSFSRQLTRTEWDILQSYTHRIRSIAYGFNRKKGLDEKSLEVLSSSPDKKPLFPNLYRLIYVADPTGLSFGLFSSSPNVTRIRIHVRESSKSVHKSVSHCICRWQHIQSLDCPHLDLDSNTLAHLACMPALSYLSFKKVKSECDDASLLYSTLRVLEISPASLTTVSQLLSRTHLPVIESFGVDVEDCPSKEELSSFLAAMKTCNSGHTIQCLTLVHYWNSVNGSVDGSSDGSMDENMGGSTDRSMNTGCLPSSLSLEDLRPYMEFSNLLILALDLKWNVGLRDDDLVGLASAWPNLEFLSINEHWGWKTREGITPNGFVQLLQACPSLDWVAIRLDTRGYTQVSPDESGSAVPHARNTTLNVLDSVVDEESVPALVALFKSIHLSSVFGWMGYDFELGIEESNDLWNDIDGQIGVLVAHLTG